MVRLSVSERDILLLDYKDSGLNASEFCRLRGVNVKTFGNWKRQFIDGIAMSSRKAERSKTKNSKAKASQNSYNQITSPAEIHPLEVIDDRASQVQEPVKSPTITLHFPNGVTAHITNVATQDITQLINSYQQCSH